MKKVLLLLSAIFLLAAGCSSTVTNYTECVKQGGEVGSSGTEGFCVINGKTFANSLAPLVTPSAKK